MFQKIYVLCRTNSFNALETKSLDLSLIKVETSEKKTDRAQRNNLPIVQRLEYKTVS